MEHAHLKYFVIWCDIERVYRNLMCKDRDIIILTPPLSQSSKCNPPDYNDHLYTIEDNLSTKDKVLEVNTNAVCSYAFKILKFILTS